MRGNDSLLKSEFFSYLSNLTPVSGKTNGKYNTSVFVGGDWQMFVQRDYEPKEAELKALVTAEMLTWKHTGVI